MHAAQQHYFIGIVPVDRILDLRHRILREGLPVEEACFEGDERCDTLHYAAFQSNESRLAAGKPIGCATFMMNSHKDVPAWQLRGMAVEMEHRSAGIGGKILAQAERQLPLCVECKDVRSLWCNAREPAVRFYEKNGWRVESARFEIPTAGPHFVMTKQF